MYFFLKTPFPVSKVETVSLSACRPVTLENNLFLAHGYALAFKKHLILVENLWVTSSNCEHVTDKHAKRGVGGAVQPCCLSSASGGGRSLHGS